MRSKYLKVEGFCISCGANELYTPVDDSDDYYEGEQFKCKECLFEFNTKALDKHTDKITPEVIWEPAR